MVAHQRRRRLDAQLALLLGVAEPAAPPAGLQQAEQLGQRPARRGAAWKRSSTWCTRIPKRWLIVGSDRDPEHARELVLQRAGAVGLDVRGAQHQPVAAVGQEASSDGSVRGATARARSFSSRSASSRYSSSALGLEDLALLGGGRLQQPRVDLRQRVLDRLSPPLRALEQRRELEQLHVAHDGVRDVEVGVEAQLAEPPADLRDRGQQLVAQQPERRLQRLRGPEQLLLALLPLAADSRPRLLGERRRMLHRAAVGALGVGEHQPRARARHRDVQQPPHRVAVRRLGVGRERLLEQGVRDRLERALARAGHPRLVLEYGASKRGGPADRLYVPADALDQVTRYVGGEQPSLDRLGGADWGKRKGRARKAVRQIAAELIKLYAARQATQGHAFGPDTPWQRELEDAFPFNETPDQLTTVDEVKDDMMKTVPMDRLVCGDVGYGKTEIAVRAAFKAVQDGKQVAVLVPTTLLVTQHLSTFQERMSGFPIRIEALSRFQTDKEARAVVDGLADGTVDIVVGTHRLLNPDIRVKDLGLIVVDEEQRFGVEHKEQMKRLRTSVDVLSMSATPIPRTLEMAITGIREMSTITTPPEERHPVLTYVGGYEDRQVTAAVRRELLREGQVFYIHNRVQSIEKAAAKIRELVPEARVAVAHGQMGEHQLEQVMLDFWEKTFDVLVCTTIVESGLDVSNANTMIIERADTLGLSPAAPAPRPGRPVPRARVRLLPLPGREAAHRDRPRAAGHAGPALRPRRRHGDRDEGPRDPRRRQPARRRAVRPHRRRRLRPLRPAGRRGGARVPGRRRSPSSTRSASSCRSTPTCRTTTSRASGCGWRCTSGWPRSAATTTSTSCSRS